MPQQHTAEVGLVGHPVDHSRSPVMQQAAFDALMIPARYAIWDTPPEQLVERIYSLRGPAMLGANVTIPYKTAVIPLLDAIEEQARATGAVNTIVREETAAGARLVGYNTDVPGLRRALAEHEAWAGGRRVLVLGAGGAARAAVAVARLEQAAVWVASRRVEAARALVAQSGDPSEARNAHAVDLADAEEVSAVLRQVNVVVNATPVGTNDAGSSPLPMEALRQLSPATFVFDMVYSPPETALVRAARARGLRALGGLLMLLYQGATAFELWTGRTAPVAVMRDALGIVR